MKSLPLLTTLLLVVSVLSLPKQAPIIGIYTQSDASD
jgi:gamma-glutamyl-gamma-aminobutyrate hydrolase PuuD